VTSELEDPHGLSAFLERRHNAIVFKSSKETEAQKNSRLLRPEIFTCDGSALGKGTAPRDAPGRTARLHNDDACRLRGVQTSSLFGCWEAWSKPGGYNAACAGCHRSVDHRSIRAGI